MTKISMTTPLLQYRYLLLYKTLPICERHPRRGPRLLYHGLGRGNILYLQLYLVAQEEARRDMLRADHRRFMYYANTIKQFIDRQHLSDALDMPTMQRGASVTRRRVTQSKLE